MAPLLSATTKRFVEVPRRSTYFPAATCNPAGTRLIHLFAKKKQRRHYTILCFIHAISLHNFARICPLPKSKNKEATPPKNRTNWSRTGQSKNTVSVAHHANDHHNISSVWLGLWHLGSCKGSFQHAPACVSNRCCAVFKNVSASCPTLDVARKVEKRKRGIERKVARTAERTNRKNSVLSMFAERV